MSEAVVLSHFKRGGDTVFVIERKDRSSVDSRNVEAADHDGLVVQSNGGATSDQNGEECHELQLDFNCQLIDATNGEQLRQQRKLQFSFEPSLDYDEKMRLAQSFFHDVVVVQPFPKVAERFILKVMKTCKKDYYSDIVRCDCILSQPISTSDFIGTEDVDERPIEERLQDDLLLTLEMAFPNVLSLDELCKLINYANEKACIEQLNHLEQKNVVRPMDEARRLWVRNLRDRIENVEHVKTMPMLQRAQQPTIAIITLMYAEKLAVDAMMEERKTFVRYKTEGESNIYTIGYIGHHKVVTTKLPAIGRQLKAQIASGNATTRLLGTFSEIEHVFLCGVGGGVPHFTDFRKHVRLGDIVVSVPDENKKLYYFCEKILQDQTTNTLNFNLKSWGPSDPTIQMVVNELRNNLELDKGFSPWLPYLESGLEELTSIGDINFSRPAQSTDRLFMTSGDNMIEVQHPAVPHDDIEWYRPGMSLVRFGTTGSGRPIVKNDILKQDFSRRYNIYSYDMEYDQVLESITGNRKDSFVFIRGIADYYDGSKGKEWQPYASLAAAAFMKYIICQMENTSLTKK